MDPGHFPRRCQHTVRDTHEAEGRRAGGRPGGGGGVLIVMVTNRTILWLVAFKEQRELDPQALAQKFPCAFQAMVPVVLLDHGCERQRHEPMLSILKIR